ncbi:MAG: diguanylate cyclase [Solirubrobacterales bacterium]|nr:diguanylate cyclase [Solirubrobacterales bacterium]
MTDAHDFRDVHAIHPVDRLLEDSWSSRSRRATRRELLAESSAAVVFLALAVPLAIHGLAAHPVSPALALLLVGLYALVARGVKFPIGAGYVVPSYLVLVPMLLLLPPLSVPLLASGGLLLGTTARWIARRASPQELLFSIPDAAHAIGPAVILALAPWGGGVGRAGVYVVAFLSACLVDLIASSLRESVTLGVSPRLQLQVILAVWVVDACVAPLGFLIARGALHAPATLLLLLPLNGLLMVVERERNARIGDAQYRLDEVMRQRSRLQSAVARLGEALAAKLELGALADVLIQGSVDALDASAAHLALHPRSGVPITGTMGPERLQPLLELASADARSTRQPRQLERDGAWAMAMPFSLGSQVVGALAVARDARSFSSDEELLMQGLVQRAEKAAADIDAHERLHEEANSDPLTLLGNRRKLAEELSARLGEGAANEPLLLMLFDLDGFKAYNDTFGHVAGDALLARLGRKLEAAIAEGSAYRLGGDEFCVLLPAQGDLPAAVVSAVEAFEERGETFAITSSYGCVLLPHEARTAEYALQLADKRMYSQKHGRRSRDGDQAHDVLIHIMRAKQSGLQDHASVVEQLAVRVGRRLGLDAEQLDELGRAAALHDIGKVGIPDAILGKPGALDPDEWEFMRQHTILGERILNAAPALRPVAAIVRSSHERWDGNGYPDRLRGDQIPLAARIVAVCDAYDAMVSDRCYRSAHTPEFALEELRQAAGSQFDSTVVTAFLEELARPEAKPSGADVVATHADSVPHAERVAEIVGHVRTLLATPTEASAAR